MNSTRPAGAFPSSPIGYRLNERRCIARDELGLYGSIITLGTYTCDSVAEDQLESYITEAVKQCIHEHAVLSTVIADAETEQPKLARISTLNLHSHIHFDSVPESTNPVEAPERNLENLLETIHNERQQDCHIRPQWRLHIVRLSTTPPAARIQFYAAFATSHSLADGMSGVVFHTTFLKSLRNLQDLPPTPSWTYEISPDAEPELLPPLDRADHFPISWTFLLGPLLQHLLPQPIAGFLGIKSTTDTPWSGAPTRPPFPAPGTLIPTAVHVTLLPLATLQRVLTACKRRNVRLTGLLNVLVARALSSIVPSRRGNVQNDDFPVETALDLRRCLPLARGQMANYASAYDATVTVTGTGTRGEALGTPGVGAKDWDSARAMTEGLASAATSLRDQPVALLKYLSKIRDWVVQRASQASTSSFSTSNLGVFDDGGSGGEGAGRLAWRVDEMLFSQSADGTGAPFNMNLASAKAGSLALVMSWWPGMLGVEDEKAFMRQVGDAVRKDLEIASAE